MISESSGTHYLCAVNALVRITGLLYLCLGVLKLHGILFPQETMSEYLSFANPVIFIVSNWSVLCIAATIEVFIGFCAWQNTSLRERSAMLLWLASSMLVYKIALIFVEYKGPCGCLFGINRFIPLATGTQRWIADIVTLYTLLLSASILLFLRYMKILNNTGEARTAS